MVLMEDDVSTELPPIPWAPMAAPAIGFDALYATEFPRLAGVLYAMGGSRSLAEEVAQDAFAHAWARWSRVSASPSPAGWVYTTAFRLMRRRLRFGRRPPPAPLRPHADAVEGTEQRIDLLAALRTLPASQQQVVALRHLLGLSTGEVAERLDLTETAVRSTLHRAMLSLRVTLGGPVALDSDARLGDGDLFGGDPPENDVPDGGGAAHG
jgi:RNA polymerase sigma-70 factor, ECF subfamily